MAQIAQDAPGLEREGLIEAYLAHESVHPPGWRMSPHMHLHHEVALVREGNCQVVLPDKTVWLQAGNAFFIPKGLLHGFQTSADEGVRFVVVQFLELDAELARELANDPPIGRFSLSQHERGEYIQSCYQIQQEVAGSLPYAHLHIPALLQHLLVLLLRSSQRGSARGLSPEQRQAMEAAVRWMHAHATEDIRVAEVATSVGLSPSHFRHLFQQFAGVSPKRYLLALRVQVSKCLLVQPGRTVSEVAALAGFGTCQEFSRAFRQVTGVPPAVWRRLHVAQPLRPYPPGPDLQTRVPSTVRGVLPAVT